MKKIKISGSGIYAPGKAINNSELKKLAGIDFDAEKLEAKIGIKERHIAKLRNIDETSADFAEKASRNALANAALDPMDVDLFIVGTDTPEYVSPATAILLQGRLQHGQKNSFVFDLGASCASFVSAMEAAASLMAGNVAIRHALVVGLYNMPAHIRPGDAFGWSIFADGAGALVLSRAKSHEASAWLGSRFEADGTQWNYVGVYAGGTRKPLTKELLDSGEYGLELLQRLPGDRNLKLWPKLIRDLCKDTKTGLEEVSSFILTQINRSVIWEVMDELGRPRELAPTAMERYGYTGSACVPMAFHDAVMDGKIKRGDKVLFCASGAGLAVGSNIFIY
ncbi:ketoacyl-ACP synthase III [Spirochaetota bacterium]